jgi:hypothetical protein
MTGIDLAGFTTLGFSLVFSLRRKLPRMWSFSFGSGGQATERASGEVREGVPLVLEEDVDVVPGSAIDTLSK